MKSRIVSCSKHQVNQAVRRIGQQLFPRRLVSGERGCDFSPLLSEINHTLIARSDYVGVAPYGSRCKGYATHTSDFDVLLIAGDSKVGTENQFSSQLNRLGRRVVKRSCSLAHCYSLDYFEINLRTPTPASNYAYSHAVWPLLYPLRGRQGVIQRLRGMVRVKHAEYLHKWPASALKNLQEAVSNILFFEWHLHVEITPTGCCTLTSPIGRHPNNYSETVEKLLKRGFTSIDIQRFVEQRGSLWWKRAVRMLNHPH